MPSSRPCRRRISWQPAMTPWKSLATSKIAALQSVTCESSASRSAGTASAAAAACVWSSSSTAFLTQTLQCPSSPPLMRTVVTAPLCGDGEGRHQVEHDVVVVAGIERDAVGGAGLDHAAHHVERAVAIERRDLDRDDILDRGKAPPERRRQHDAADGGLQIEADQRNFARDGLRVRDQLVFAGALHGGEREQARRDSRGRARSALPARPARCGRQGRRS